MNKRPWGGVFVTMLAMLNDFVRFRPFRGLPPFRLSALVLPALLLTSASCDKGGSQGATAAPAQAEAHQAEGASASPIAANAPEVAAGKADGESCSASDECASGMCEGGCGEDNLGRCMPKDRPCTYDLVPYCGCDGQTFEASGTCPGRRFARKGTCEDAAAETPPATEG